MTWIEVIIALAIFFILSTISETILRKKYQIAKRKGWIYEPVNLVHKRAERILFWGYLLIYTVLLFSGYQYASYFIFGFLLLLNGLRVFMEWKYDRERKEYIISINALSWFTLFVAYIIQGLLEK